MDTERRTIAESFDARADSYDRNDWHRRCAERLIALCAIAAGSCVLDACTGTGFAALAAGKAVGPEGRVVGVDISPGMLRKADAAVRESGCTNVALMEADATQMSEFAPATFDAITCAAGLLYMPVSDALREWHRLLKKGGVVAFSTMRAGSPLASRIFRECAAAFGVRLRDPSEPLGSEAACRQVLEAAGFEVIKIVSEIIEFSTQDLTLAWASNFGSAAHADVRHLTADDQRSLKASYLAALDRLAREDPGALERADILYAVGRR